MKIENNSANHIKQAQLQSTAAVETNRQRGPAKAERPAAERDQVALSDQALALSKAKSELRVAPEIRADKVEPLRQAVANGTYQVPHEKLAKKLMSIVA